MIKGSLYLVFNVLQTTHECLLASIYFFSHQILEVVVYSSVSQAISGVAPEQRDTYIHYKVAANVSHRIINITHYPYTHRESCSGPKWLA